MVHDKEGLFSGWNLKNITIQHAPSNKQWKFEADQWMDGNEIELFPDKDEDSEANQPNMDSKLSENLNTDATMEPSLPIESIEGEDSPDKDEGKKRSWFRFPGSKSDEKNKQPDKTESSVDVEIDGASNVDVGEEKDRNTETGNRFGFNINLPRFKWGSGDSKDKIDDENNESDESPEKEEKANKSEGEVNMNDEELVGSEQVDGRMSNDKLLSENSRTGFGLKFPKMPSINFGRKNTGEQETLVKDPEEDEGQSPLDPNVSDKGKSSFGLKWPHFKGSSESPTEVKDEDTGDFPERSSGDDVKAQLPSEANQTEPSQKKSGFKFGLSLPKISMPKFSTNRNVSFYFLLIRKLAWLKLLSTSLGMQNFIT